MRFQYSDAVAILGKRDSKKHANNTYFERRDNGDIAYRLHDTDVVTFHPDNTATLDSGGWMTNTTRDRMSLVANIGQRKHVWYLNGDVQYFDGIRINLETGAVVNPRDMSSENAATEKMLKAITKYVAGFDTDWARDALGADVTYSNFTERYGAATGGDCWDCLMHGVDNGRSMGDMSGDHEYHFVECHFTDGYRPLSLVRNAFKEMSYGNPDMVFMMRLCDLAQGNTNWAAQDIHKAVREYLMRRLVSGVSQRVAASHSTGYAVR